MKAQLPHELTIALGQYFLNARRAIRQHLCVTVQAQTVVETYEPANDCSRPDDLHRIIELCESMGFACHSRDDEFIFQAESRYFRVTEEVWPMAEVVRPKRRKKF